MRHRLIVSAIDCSLALQTCPFSQLGVRSYDGLSYRNLTGREQTSWCPVQWLIAYDISKDANRRKVARRLEQLGFRRQLSVFEGELTVERLQDLFTELTPYVDESTDSLTAWPSVESPCIPILHRGQDRVLTQKAWGDTLIEKDHDMPTLRTTQRLIHDQIQSDGQTESPLMQLMGDSTILDAAWKRVIAGGRKTPGPDSVTPASVQTQPGGVAKFLSDIATELQAGTYQPGPVRRYRIEKANAESFREIAVLSLRDSVVHMAVKLLLDPVVEATSEDKSYGFRPGQSRFDELLAIARKVQSSERHAVALTTDVADCFGCINHQVLIASLSKLIGDCEFLRLIELILRQVGHGERGWLSRRYKGVLQGSPLSPVLANLALRPFDTEWKHRHGKRHSAFRYADDIVVLADSASTARKLKRQLKSVLWQTTKMKLAATKTHIARFEQGVPVLGMLIRTHTEPYDQRTLTSLFVDPERVRGLFCEIDEWCERLTPDSSIPAEFRKLNQKLRGWFETYQFAYDAPQVFEAIDYHVFRVARSQLKSAHACTAAELQRDHHIYLASGHETWTAEGESILVLGSLPRRQYRPKRNAIPWRDVSPTKDAQAPVEMPVPGVADNQEFVLPSGSDSHSSSNRPIYVSTPQRNGQHATGG